MSDQSKQVLTAIRRLIISGDLHPGERILEIPISERLGVSRTPVRTALKLLEQEGLVQLSGKRGYRVRQFHAAEVIDAIHVRGVLEGLAARTLAEKGVVREVRLALQDCLDRGDAVFEHGAISDDGIERFLDINSRFHATILDACGNLALKRALSLNDRLPFASSRSITFDIARPQEEYMRLYIAHQQHHVVYEAMVAGHGVRADTVMQEHAIQAVKAAEILSSDDQRIEKLRIVHDLRGDAELAGGR